MKGSLPDVATYVYVIETYLMQRSFIDLSISEKAAVLAERCDKVLYQRKRNEIITELKELLDKERCSSLQQFNYLTFRSKDRNLP